MKNTTTDSLRTRAWVAAYLMPAVLLGSSLKFDGKFERLESKFDRKLNWAMSIGIAYATGILGAMARGFGWI